MNDQQKLAFDRRLFLQGLTLSSAGLLVPRPVIAVPRPRPVIYSAVVDCNGPHDPGAGMFKTLVSALEYASPHGFDVVCSPMHIEELTDTVVLPSNTGISGGAFVVCHDSHAFASHGTSYVTRAMLLAKTWAEPT